KTPDKTAAQYFHFDMDRIKWLKFFIYITDVGPDNGPHSFIAKSHRSGGIPGELLQGFYKRLTDEEVFTHYGPKSRIEFTGVKGTIIAEDTRGLHKGKHVQSGDRLVFQLQYSNSLFGGEYSPVKLESTKSKIFAEKLRLWPRLYSTITVL
ncbi:MAG: phytanoyl-CoA dioxygenase, partial [Pseudomonadota bacterium]